MLATICFSSYRSAMSAAQWAMVLIKALILTAIIVGTVAFVVAAWAVIQQLLVGGLLIALFMLATKPKAVRK